MSESSSSPGDLLSRESSLRMKAEQDIEQLRDQLETEKAAYLLAKMSRDHLEQELTALKEKTSRALGDSQYGERSGTASNYGAGLIAAERHRQVSVEDWTPEHDDEHDGGQLLAAAVCYADAGCEFDLGLRLPPWPFEASSWKPSDDLVRNLVKAGALIAAEIDRLQRACPTCGGLLRGSFPECIDCQVVSALRDGR